MRYVVRDEKSLLALGFIHGPDNQSGAFRVHELFPVLLIPGKGPAKDVPVMTYELRPIYCFHSDGLGNYCILTELDLTFWNRIDGFHPALGSK
jgi:hypothetical protein